MVARLFWHVLNWSLSVRTVKCMEQRVKLQAWNTRCVLLWWKEYVHGSTLAQDSPCSIFQAACVCRHCYRTVHGWLTLSVSPKVPFYFNSIVSILYYTLREHICCQRPRSVYVRVAWKLWGFIVKHIISKYLYHLAVGHMQEFKLL